MIPRFNTKQERLDWLMANKDSVIAIKQAKVKEADAVSYVYYDEVEKVNKPVTEDVDAVKVKAVINTTNLMDSHDDVHIPGLWSKSLKENRAIMHLQEHQLSFDKIIADGEDLKAYTQSFTWKDLGQGFDGVTEALVFESKVTKDRNEFMFDQYRKARVKNHSVGMRYVKLVMAVDSDEDYWKDEKKNWDKYIDQVANRKDAEAQGYFFAVTEAKVIEGSAVPLGSNWATPTLDNNLKEPPEGTPKEPQISTLETEEVINRIKNFKFY